MENIISGTTLFALIGAVFIAAGLVKGISGMGLPTVAMGLLGGLLTPVAAAALLVVPSFVTNVWQLLDGARTAALLRRLAPMMAGVLLGTVPGTLLLTRVDARWSACALGLALAAYALYALCAPPLSIPARAERWLSPVVGLATGIVTGATGVFVIPAVPYLQALGLEKDELVQALGLSFTISTVALAFGLALHGAFRVDQLGLSTLAVLPALAGMWLGQKIRRRIGAQTFRRAFLALLLLLGLELMSRPFV
ncbi:sulfite exporter TauE/SafE family protein [Pseudothauera nasutitermitis]|uniref:Probable membrane transporter protein n=1 Tax=Pseudothauera nasutitermitis TaxID=2565930 RepID=A0A4S4B1J8_9RHOO|nr:sulfite exporter TauE/SafE family protein [Pseudothauera nasutitermitis]THF66432.1 sulfite exporter TauE/SafE family protein [Pseudothauera nasutitermitis]